MYDFIEILTLSSVTMSEIIETPAIEKTNQRRKRTQHMHYELGIGYNSIILIKIYQ